MPLKNAAEVCVQKRTAVRCQAVAPQPNQAWQNSIEPFDSLVVTGICVVSSMANKNSTLRCTFSAPSHSTTLLQGLSELRAQGQLLDVVLAINEEHFLVHRAVLAACSDYFRSVRITRNHPLSEHLTLNESLELEGPISLFFSPKNWAELHFIFCSYESGSSEKFKKKFKQKPNNLKCKIGTKLSAIV